MANAKLPNAKLPNAKYLNTKLRHDYLCVYGGHHG